MEICELDTLFTDIADAIREKDGTTEGIRAKAFPERVRSLSGGGNISANPIGTVISYLGTNAPDDYLLCDGSVYDISDYPDLAKFIGEQFGAVNHFGGDGETTFAVPDMRGRFLLNGSEEYGLGDVGGEKEVTLTVEQMPKHQHKYPLYSEGEQTGFGTTAWQLSANLQTSTKVLTDSAGNDKPHQNMPPYMVVTYCIKAKETASSGGSGSSSESNPGEVYSTEETRIGTWIDGKPLYRRVILTDVLASDYGQDVEVTKLADEVIHNAHAFVTYADSLKASYPMPYYASQYQYGQLVVSAEFSPALYVNLKRQGAPSAAVTTVIEYTKTTD